MYLPYGLAVSSKTGNDIEKGHRLANCDQPVTSYCECLRAYDLTRNTTNTIALNNINCSNNFSDYQTIFVSLWSDGCDPNARTKTNRGSMHITTVSILSDIHRNDERNTFVVAVGREGHDHTEVRTIIYDDINKMRNTHVYFDGKSYVPLQVILLCNIADRPERSESTGFGSHNGELTLRWGYVCAIAVNLPSCKHCMSNREQNLSRMKCTECHDWDFLNVKIKVDKHFPTDVPEYCDGFIASHKFCFKNAYASSNHCFTQLKLKKWGTGKAKSYLRHQGINNKVIDKLIDGSTSDTCTNIVNIVPPMWRPDYNFDMKNQIPAFMHLCFLGVTQTVGYTVKELLINYGKYTKYRQQDMLKHMRRFSLDWCRIWTYGSNKTPYGPWTAENYLGYARILKSMYSNAKTVTSGATHIDDRIHNAKLITKLASALNAMISRIMQPKCTEGSALDTERHIKLFLSILTELDDINITCHVEKQAKLIATPTVVTQGKKKTSKSRNLVKKRKINSTSNLTSLLNIPDFMRQHGPPRLYWEGGFKGEGILRAVKPIVTQGTHMSWFATAALQRYYNEKSMKLLLDSENRDLIDDNNFNRVENYTDRKVFTYKFGYGQIVSDIGNGNPVSAALCDDTGYIYCVTVHNKKKWFESL